MAGFNRGTLRYISLALSSSPLSIDFPTMINRAGEKDLMKLFDNIPEKYFDLLSLYYFSDEDVEALTADQSLLINTDDYPFLEYAYEFHAI